MQKLSFCDVVVFINFCFLAAVERQGTFVRLRNSSANPVRNVLVPHANFRSLKKSELRRVLYVAVGAVVRDSPDTGKAYLRELPKPVSEYASDEEMIQDITNITVDYIRMAPEQYCWLYKRFQHIPPDTPEEIRKRYPDYARVPKDSFFSRSKIRQAKYRN